MNGKSSIVAGRTETGTRESQTKKWRATIKVDGKTYRLGRFGDQLAAALAYDEAARKWFGEHARLNFPDGVDAWLEREYHRPAAA